MKVLRFHPKPDALFQFISTVMVDCKAMVRYLRARKKRGKA